MPSGSTKTLAVRRINTDRENVYTYIRIICVYMCVLGMKETVMRWGKLEKEICKDEIVSCESGD
jgi:hypothetical protein